jgi:hypothetical protein
MELVNYLYGWYTNEEHTTWYRQQEEESAEVLLSSEEVTPVKRTRKTKTK